MAWNLLQNNVYGTLDAGINNAATTMNVTLVAGSKDYPAGISATTPMYLTIADPDNPFTNEIVKVTAATGANVTTMVRGQRGTTAQTWNSGAIVSLNLNYQDITERQDTINPLAGAVGAPSFYFSTDTASGFYRSAANEICATISGTAVATFKAGRVMFAAGTVSVPGINFGDADTGPYHYGTNQLGFAAGGVARFVIGSTTQCFTDFIITRDAAPTLTFTSYNAASAHGRMNFYAGRGTESSPANLSSSDEIGAVWFRAWGTGTTFNAVGKINCLATEAHSSTAEGCKIQFQVTPNGSTTSATALTIDQDKTLTIEGPIDHNGSTIGVFGTAPTTKQTVSGAKGSNAALGSLLTALAAYGLITDSTTA